MLILAIDQSTVRASIALMRDETVVADAEWVQVRRGGASVVSAVPGLLKQAGIAAAEIDLYAVGLGPGTFSSLRVSVSAAAGLALPGEKPVVGIASAEAIAWDVWQQTGRTPLAIVGDARRERLWYVQFEARDGGLAVVEPYRLIAAPEAAATLRQSALTVSPDRDRLQAVLSTAAATGVEVSPDVHGPRAATVGRLARLRTGGKELVPGPTPSPIYVHPPVFVEPRFRATGEVLN